MPSNKKPFKLNIEKPTSDFNQHLSLDNNERIIFSGGFGTGKTYFLKEYFQNSEKYEVIHLFPVNYSVASNQDIFELLKVDLIVELFKKPIEFKKLEFSKLLTFQFYLQKEVFNIYELILNNVLKIGKIIPYGEQLLQLKSEAETLIGKYDEFHKKNQVDQEADLRKYLVDKINEPGSIFEDDIITQLIRGLVNQLKESGKEVILIIDDLDRIDPEHIFRLLNVFSAHFDISNTANKFDFDKVILVCDIANIRNIFHAKYGLKIDFNGYIDKFYSKEVFNFDNSKVIIDTTVELLSTIKFEGVSSKDFNFRDRNNSVTNDSIYILKCMIQVNSLNLRSLIKLNSSKYICKSYDILLAGKKIDNNYYPIFKIFDFLKFVFGNEFALESAIHKCTQVIDFDDYDRGDINHFYKVSTLMPILDAPRSFTVNPNCYEYFNSTLGLSITYMVKSYQFSTFADVLDIVDIEKLRYFVLLEETFKKFKLLAIV